MFQENSIETCILSRVGREVGGGIGMGKTCEPRAFSFQCMTKFTTNKKKKRKRKKKCHFPVHSSLYGKN